VAVLQCTLNGGEFLEEQLDSIGRQDTPECCVYASDDGSSDETLGILERFRNNWGVRRLCISRGPQRGHVANFFSLICSPQIDADYFAFADQDDIWDTGKLSRALAILAVLPDDRPALYCARTRLVDQAGAPIGLSPLFRRSPGFANALIHNIGGGNTMVLNRCARELLRAAGQVDIVSHDWWTYILVAGAGGAVVYDAHPSLSYRQHRRNLIGSNMSWRERFSRFRGALQGRNRKWNSRNIIALQHSRSLLRMENLETLDEFCRARNAWLVPRALGMWRSGVYAQSVWGNLALIAATFLKKI